MTARFKTPNRFSACSGFSDKNVSSAVAKESDRGNDLRFADEFRLHAGDVVPADLRSGTRHRVDRSDRLVERIDPEREPADGIADGPAVGASRRPARNEADRHAGNDGE